MNNPQNWSSTPKFDQFWWLFFKGGPLPLPTNPELIKWSNVGVVLQGESSSSGFLGWNPPNKETPPRSGFFQSNWVEICLQCRHPWPRSRRVCSLVRLRTPSFRPQNSKNARFLHLCFKNKWNLTTCQIIISACTTSVGPFFLWTEIWPCLFACLFVCLYKTVTPKSLLHLPRWARSKPPEGVSTGVA